MKTRTKDKKEETMKFYMNNKKGFYNASGNLIAGNNFIVFKGSKIKMEYSKGQKYSLGVNKTRSRLLDVHIKMVDGELILINDYTFSSPSLAAAVVKGSDCNGWEEWRNQEGEDLDSIHRK